MHIYQLIEMTPVGKLGSASQVNKDAEKSRASGVRTCISCYITLFGILTVLWLSPKLSMMESCCSIVIKPLLISH